MNTGKKEKGGFHWKQLLNYQSVMRQIPFFLFMAVLAVVYIYNGHYADKAIRDRGRLTRELMELQNEYKSVKGDVLGKSKPSEVIKAVEPLGLKELTVTPVILVDSGTYQ
jgi:cell division protein FtsL